MCRRHNTTVRWRIYRPTSIEIRPSRGLFDLELDAVWRYRELLIVLTLRDIQVLYKQAALGRRLGDHSTGVRGHHFFHHFWPLRKNAVRRNTLSGFCLRCCAAMDVLRDSGASWRRSVLSPNAELVRKVYFPRLIIPLAGVIAPCSILRSAFVVLLGVMFWFDVMPSWRLLATPPLLAIAALLALAMGLWLGPINVRFRDVKHTLPFMLQIWMYATPIVYPLSIIPAEWRWLYSLNPMVGVIEGFRWAIFGKGNPDVVAIGLSLFIIGLLADRGADFLQANGAIVRGPDMNQDIVISAERLGKRYRRGLASERHNSIRDTLAAGVGALFRGRRSGKRST